jgi:flagellar hook-associated protein 2
MADMRMGDTFMATSSSIPSASTSLTTPTTLTGVSKYSSDFQSVLNRAVAIANLPVTALQNKDATILSQESDLATLGNSVSAFQASLTALGTLAANQALVATSSDTSVVSAQATGATSAANYTISNITSIASAASETSQTGYADSSSTNVSSTGTLSLVVGSKSYPIHLTSATNNLVGLETAINNLGVGVTASVLTTGTGTTPDYLSVTANATGATTLQLIDDPTPGANTNLLTSANQGSDAVFQLNKLNVDKPDNTINDVIPGLTFTIENTTAAGKTVNLSLATDSSQLQSALQDFVTTYNAVNDAVTTQVGRNAGSLSGDFVVRQVQSDLRLMIAHQGTGAIQSLSGLGIQIANTGQMSLDATTVNSLSSSQVSAAFSFLGSTTTGLGGFSQQFAGITDPYIGLIATQQAGYKQTDTNLQNQISSLNDRISVMQTALTGQLEAADALEAQLESQQNVLSATIQSLNYSAFGASSGTSNTVG